jgi:hypothetical protein
MFIGLTGADRVKLTPGHELESPIGTAQRDGSVGRIPIS